jgi:hypothetical protein
MVKVKTKKKAKTFENSDLIGFLVGYCQEFFEEGLGMTEGELEEVSSPIQEDPFAKWLQDQKEFLQTATNSDFDDMAEDEIHTLLRKAALGLILNFYGITRYDDFNKEAYGWDVEDIWMFFEDEEWLSALQELSDDDRTDFEMVGIIDEEEEEEEEEMSLDEAIASNAIADLAANVEGEKLYQESLESPNIANLPTIPEEVESSVEDFMNEIKEAQTPVAEITLPLSVSSDAVPWATLAAIAKHKSKLDKNDNPVKALANAVEELVDEGAVVTQRGLLDAMLILIEAEPADAQSIVETWSKLN